MGTCARSHRHQHDAGREAVLRMSESTGTVAPLDLCVDCAADYARGAVADTYKDHIGGGTLERTVTVGPIAS